MQTGAQRGLGQLEAALTAALEAAAEQASRRAKGIIMTARLASAVRMRQAAESGLAPQGRAGSSWAVSQQAAPAEGPVAAGLARGGDRQ